MRRLGAAVIKQWALAEKDRTIILDQANMAEDPKYMTVQLREQLQSIIREQRI